MDFGLKQFIVAVVTLNKDSVSPGSMTPVFYAQDEEHLKDLSIKVSRTVRGMIHEVDKGTYIIVKH